MSKKTVLITGASRGIGRETAIAFANNNYNVVVNCKKSADDLFELKEYIEKEFKTDCLALISDVSKYEEVEKMYKEIDKRFGTLDVLVNNAGISHIGLLEDMSFQKWSNVIETNLNSVFNCSKLAIPYMIKKKSGRIINVSSVWGIYGASCEVAYSASKGGINAFTKALAKELAPSNINVNAIAFGVIDTEMNRCFSEEERAALANEIGCGRFGTCAEAADIIIDLANNHNYLTGQVIQFDGGWI